jgi:TRAP-type uncharacterized transport system fused permease subunit
VICTLLGMGMPTSGVYVLLAALVAPSLVEAGVQPLAAHLFILYFGMMSMITPPVALAAFAAATITKADPMGTGFAAMRVGWAAYIIPFVFVATPALLLEGSWSTIAIACLLCVIGVAGICFGVVGFVQARIGAGLRVAFVALGLAALPAGYLPASWDKLHVAGAVATCALATALFVFRRSDAPKTQLPEPVSAREER